MKKRPGYAHEKVTIASFFTTSSQTALLFLHCATDGTSKDFLPTTFCRGYRIRSQVTSVELHQTGTFEGRSTD